MRRILTGVLASAFLALALPAAASAHHRARHDARGARSHHHRRHHRTVVFAPTAKPSTTPASETPPSEEPVATVASFEGGVLKITLPDGSTASGKVTEETWIGCGCDHHFEGPPSQGSQPEGSQGDENGQGDDGESGPGAFQHDDAQMPEGESCGVSSLVPGAKVKEAELSVSGAGAVWQKVELLPKS